jgi:hypothetical protein
MIALLFVFAALIGTPPGFCDSLKTLAAAKDFRQDGPLKSIRLEGSEYTRLDADRGYLAVMKTWPPVEEGNLDPEVKALVLKRFATVNQDVARCLFDWDEASIVGSDARPEFWGGSAFVKEGRTVEVQIYDNIDEGFELRIQVLGPRALAAPTKPLNALCPTLKQVIKAHEAALDFGSLKNSPVIPPGAKSAAVVLTEFPPREYLYRAMFGEWRYTSDEPSAAQMNEIRQSLLSVTNDVMGCLSPVEWTPVREPPKRGSLGVVEFVRGKTAVRVTGNVWYPLAEFLGGKPGDNVKRIEVVLYVREKK